MIVCSFRQSMRHRQLTTEQRWIACDAWKQGMYQAECYVRAEVRRHLRNSKKCNPEAAAPMREFALMLATVADGIRNRRRRVSRWIP